MTVGGSGITLEDVHRIWPVATPIRLRPTLQGANNRAYIVEGDTGTYFLKRHDNNPDRERLLLVSRLTAELSAVTLPFAVPVTILTRSGEAHAVHDERSWTLSTFIAGDTARYGDPEDAAACGWALAELHAALARVPSPLGDEALRDLGDLSTIHPLVPEPARAIRTTVSDARLAEQTAAILTAAQRRVTAVTAGWPLTWIHWDLYPSNVLMQSRHVTGIVDFEIAGSGHRAMDVTIGLYAFAFWQPDMWSLIDRFATGYLNRLPLSAEEIEAVPTLMLMREAMSLVHWTGRSLQGLPDRMGVTQRAERLVELARFLEGRGTEIVAGLHEIGSRQR